MAGYKYLITVKMVKSECRKDNAKDACAAQQGSAARVMPFKNLQSPDPAPSPPHVFKCDKANFSI